MTDEKTSPPQTPAVPYNSHMVGGGVGIPAAVIIVWAVQAFGHVTVPGEVAAALGAVLASAAGFFHSQRVGSK